MANYNVRSKSASSSAIHYVNDHKWNLHVIHIVCLCHITHGKPVKPGYLGGHATGPKRPAYRTENDS